MLLHGFQQSTLNLGGSTVDFIGKDEVGKYRTTLHLEVLVFLGIYHRTYHVGGQQVWSKLDTTTIIGTGATLFVPTPIV